MTRSAVLARFVITVEQIDGAFKVHCIGSDRKPLSVVGSSAQWPIDTIAGHMLAVVERRMDTPLSASLHDQTISGEALEAFQRSLESHLPSGGGE